MVVGLALSFTFATVALVYVIDALGLPDDLVRMRAIVVLLVFGLSLLIPRSAPASRPRSAGWCPPGPGVRGSGDGFGSGLVPARASGSSTRRAPGRSSRA